MEHSVPNRSSERLSILLLNQTWLAEELRALGHDVCTVGWVPASFDVQLSRPIWYTSLFQQLPQGFTPNRLVYFDDSYPVNVLGLEECTVPSLLVSIDAHHHHGWHRGFGTMFSRSLVAQRDYLHHFREVHQEEGPNRSQWFPLWATEIIEPSSTKSVDVCFRGNLDPELHPERAEFFRRLAALVPIDAAAGHYSRAYPHAKIVVNQTVMGDLNFRVFEAMMCGALLITPRIGNGLEELFTPGTDIVTYAEGDAAEAAALIRHYLAHDAEREEIAAAGRRKVLAEHSAQARARQLEQHLLEIDATPAAYRYLGAASTYINSIAVYSYKGNGKMRRVMDELVDRLFRLTTHNLVQYAHQGNSFDNDLEVLFLLCKTFLDDQRRYPISLDLSCKLSSLRPQTLPYTLHYLESLLATGDEETARSLASSISTRPGELLEQVPRLLADARVQVLAAVGMITAETASGG